MGILDALFGGSRREAGNLEDAMQAIEDQDVDVLHGPAEYYVKPISLEGQGDIASVEGELKASNVVLLNIAPVARNPAKLKDSLSALTNMTHALDGDIARISEDKILLTPKKMKIVKGKPRA